jgi:hypothetical protein
MGGIVINKCGEIICSIDVAVNRYLVLQCTFSVLWRGKSLRSNTKNSGLPWRRICGKSRNGSFCCHVERGRRIAIGFLVLSCRDILAQLREIVAGAFNIRIVVKGRESETKHAGHT